MTIGGFFALAGAPAGQLASGEIVDLAIVGTGVVALFVGLFLTARAASARRAMSAQIAELRAFASATPAPSPAPAPAPAPAPVSARAPAPILATPPAPPPEPEVPHAIKPELELVRAFAKILATQRLSSERDRAAFMHHALVAAADALTERLDPSTLSHAPATYASPTPSAVRAHTPAPIPSPAQRTFAPSSANTPSTSPTPVPSAPPPILVAAPSPVPAPLPLTPMAPLVSELPPTPLPPSLTAELSPTPLRPPAPQEAVDSMPPLPLSRPVSGTRPLPTTTSSPPPLSTKMPAAPLLPQISLSAPRSAPSSDPALELGDPFSVRTARASVLPRESQAPASRRSRRPPPGGRLTGDDLLSDLFDLMHGLSFFESALEGADFVLASALEEIPCRAALCHFYDSTRRDFVLVRGVGAGHEKVLLGRTPGREPLIEPALRSRKPTIINLEANDERARTARWSKLGPPRSLAVVPVMSGVRFLALLELADPTHGGAFADGDDHALSYVAEQFAIFLGEKGLVLDDKTLKASLSGAPPDRKRATR